MKKRALYASIALLPVLGFAPLTIERPEAKPVEKLQKLETPPKAGDSMPMFLIDDASGDGFHDLSKLLEQGPVVINFFRGSWCPYCIGELTAVQKHLGDITSAGATVLAISPEKPSKTADLMKQKSLGFLFGTDDENALARKLALSFELDAKTIKRYKRYGIDLNEANNSQKWELPIPATYVIDTDGTVAWAFVDEDYSKRPDYALVVKKLRDMQQDD